MEDLELLSVPDEETCNYIIEKYKMFAVGIYIIEKADMKKTLVTIDYLNVISTSNQNIQLQITCEFINGILDKKYYNLLIT